MLFRFIIALPMMVCLYWCIYFMVRMMRPDEERRVTGSILAFYVASTVLYTNHWLYFSGCTSFLGWWTYTLANLSVYPLYYAYLLALTRTHSRTELLCLFIPTVIVALFSPLNHAMDWFSRDTIWMAVRVCFALLVIWVWVRGFHLLRRTTHRLDDTYTDDRSYALQPTRILLILIGITAAVSTLLNILGSRYFLGNQIIVLPALIMSALLYGLGYVAAHTVLPIETVVPEEEPAETAQDTTTEETDAMMLRIAGALREQQLFADPHLTIQDMANAIGSNRTYVSRCINRRTGLSFSQYVARYRVEHAQQILRDPQYRTDHEAITEAASLSGFSSDQTFYRVFKEQTDLTPLQYRQQNLKND
ncbi:MAG: helix-turn-helix transcriptional regulator [Paludibacteraceae bacterium]|nr:helix-turn-helix transcriptional regulator [Paludibacteraceae bacterium]